MHRVNTCVRAVLFLALILPLHVLAEEPSLPSGLGGGKPEGSQDEPGLPSGLGSGEIPSEPTQQSSTGHSSLPVSVSGFFESRGGVRYDDDPLQKRASIGESRLQLGTELEGELATFNLTADFLADTVANDWPLDLESGSGFLDLREASALYRLGNTADIKLGRQILTWGTGDFVFINDLFPKDWNSFFNGRDDEYLKAPSDALKISAFSSAFNVDFVYTPRFDSDRYIDGERFSFFDQRTGSIAGGDDALSVDQRSSYFSEDEFAARLYTDVESYELALYGYYGYWKSPGGFDPASGQALFPRLASYGASLRGPLSAGIVNAEFGYYQSRDDLAGSNPFVNNSELRYLIGYEQELLPELTGGFQYYVEQLVDYDEYRGSVPMGAPVRDEFRHLLTMRLTKLLLNQNLRLSLFWFVSPSDRDMYIRSHANYKITDRWQVELGTNVFAGEEQYSFFGMFEDASNIYVSARYSFVVDS